MSRHTLISLGLSLTLLAPGAGAQEATDETESAVQADRHTFERLAQETRAIKSRMLELEAELSELEEQIRYPGATRWTVFVTAGALEDRDLRQMELYVDGRNVASHRYSDKERAALRSGGAHRLFIGNLDPGKHRVVAVAVLGDADDGTELEHSFPLTKAPGPRLLELRVEGQGNGSAPAISQHAYPDEA